MIEAEKRREEKGERKKKEEWDHHHRVLELIKKVLNAQSQKEKLL